VTKPLLIEIGVEELPAIPFLKELKNIHQKWDDILNTHKLKCDFTFKYTPRRLVLIHENFPLKQPQSKETFFGAPVSIAYKDGKPTAPALGFAKKCAISVDEIKTIEKNGKEVLYYEKEVEGKNSTQLLEMMIEEFLKNLQFGKSMRWGNHTQSFIRPVRWIVCMLDDKNVSCEVFGVKSDLKTYVHRTDNFAPLEFSDIKSYLSLLENHHVILDDKKRKEQIEADFDAIETKHGVEIEKDDELLNEVIAITEYPKALLGTFDENFLQLPPEVIITSMKEHQRYFPVFKNNKLSNHFVVVSNAVCDDYTQVILGNEKVLRPRLSDGLFFYENDIKNGLNNEGLKNITFMQGLGSIYDKSQRESFIALYLHDKYKLSEDVALLEKTMMLSKADLLTDMVYEFTELEGIMGYYYAKIAGEDEKLCLALKEQYLPDGEDSLLPSNSFSAVVAMSNKLDTILSLFAANKIPTGTKDPFGLRRGVVGIVKIIQKYGFDFDIHKDLEILASRYEGVDQEKLENFFIDRLLHYFDANASVIQAVLQSGERDINQITKKIQALKTIVESDNFKEISSTFKRVANIVKDIDLDNDLTVDEKLLDHDAEKVLFEKFTDISKKDYGSYEEQLEALFSLKPQIDNFFDTVMVNVEDEAIKNNRKNLIASIYKAFREIAEIKVVTL